MTRPIFVSIDKAALRHNLARVRHIAGKRDVWAVVKANAYGHGLANAADAFQNADGLAVLEVKQAQLSRACGWKKRILLIEGFFDETELETIQELDAETVVHSEWMIEALYRQAPFRHLRVHVKINSGMNRLGFAPQEYESVARRIAAIPGCTVEGFITHFANAEQNVAPGKKATVVYQLDRLGGLANAQNACMANSGATLFHPEVAGSALRAGVVLYGVSPDDTVTSDELGIIPAMTLKARVIALRDVPAGQAVGYGSRWVAKRDSRIAVLACGYADGYPRSMPDGSPVWIEGRIAPLAGAVSMDMLTVDVTDIAECKVGSWAELWGRHVSVNDLAKRCGTIGYELLTAIAPRVPVVADATENPFD